MEQDTIEPEKKRNREPETEMDNPSKRGRQRETCRDSEMDIKKEKCHLESREEKKESEKEEEEESNSEMRRENL